METITFCKKHCCPVVKVDNDKIILGDDDGPEGITIWTKDQFLDFVQAVKDGKFDQIK
jgi:hypothetical protein